MRIENHVDVNGFALSLALKQRLEVTQKWPIIVLLRYNSLKKIFNILSIVERDQLEKRTAVGLKKITGRKSQTSVRKRQQVEFLCGKRHANEQGLKLNFYSESHIICY